MRSFVSARKRLELLEEFGVDVIAWLPRPTRSLIPTTTWPRPRGSTRSWKRPARDDDPQARELRVVRWGLVPAWAKDASGGGRLINARAETVAVKPAFRRAFAKRRCILPADGYYEWQAISDEGKSASNLILFTERMGGHSPSPESTNSGGTRRYRLIMSTPGCGRPRLSRPRRPTMSARSTIECPW